MQRISWLVAGGYRSVMPASPISLAGYVERDAVFHAIDEPLEVNALVLGSGGRRLVILTFDLLFVGRTLRDDIEQHLARRHGISARDVLLIASHTHFAPASMDDMPRVGQPDPAYVRMLSAESLALIDQLLTQASQTAELRVGVGEANSAINRRWIGLRRSGWHIERRCEFAPNPRALADPGLTVLRFDGDGGTRGLLWHYTCHPVGFPDRLTLTAEYPGVVRRALRKHFGGELPVIFLPGFAGDVRPRIVKPRERHGRALLPMLGEPPLDFEVPSVERWRAWAHMLAQAATETAQRAASAQPEPPAIATAQSDVPLDRLLAGGAAGRTVRSQRVMLGPRTQFIALSGEPTMPHAATVTQRWPGQRTLPLGYTGDAFGYFPTDAQLRQGGYEADGFIDLVGLHGPFREPPDRVLVELMDGLERVA